MKARTWFSSRGTVRDRLGDHIRHLLPPALQSHLPDLGRGGHVRLLALLTTLYCGVPGRPSAHARAQSASRWLRQRSLSVRRERWAGRGQAGRPRRGAQRRVAELERPAVQGGLLGDSPGPGRCPLSHTPAAAPRERLEQAVAPSGRMPGPSSTGSAAPSRGAPARFLTCPPPWIAALSSRLSTISRSPPGQPCTGRVADLVGQLGPQRPHDHRAANTAVSARSASSTSSRGSDSALAAGQRLQPVQQRDDAPLLVERLAHELRPLGGDRSGCVPAHRGSRASR